MVAQFSGYNIIIKIDENKSPITIYFFEKWLIVAKFPGALLFYCIYYYFLNILLKITCYFFTFDLSK